MRRTTPRLLSEEGGRRGPRGDVDVPPGEYIELLATDFGGIYQVYIAASDERLKMVRLAMSFLAGPFGVVTALVSAKIIEPAALTSWHIVPPYVFGLIVAAALLTVVPYLRLIEATGTHMRMARVMNNFRLLYVQKLKDHFDELGWTPNLPVDPRYPETFAPMSGPGVTIILLAVLDAAYLAIGFIGLADAEPSPILLLGTITLATAVLLLLYYVRTNISRRRHQPANPFGFPYVET